MVPIPHDPTPFGVTVSSTMLCCTAIQRIRIHELGNLYGRRVARALSSCQFFEQLVPLVPEDGELLSIVAIIP
jgi:uncharacterized protein (DUF697 family)